MVKKGCSEGDFNECDIDWHLPTETQYLGHKERHTLVLLVADEWLFESHYLQEAERSIIARDQQRVKVSGSLPIFQHPADRPAWSVSQWHSQRRLSAPVLLLKGLEWEGPVSRKKQPKSGCQIPVQGVYRSCYEHKLQGQPLHWTEDVVEGSPLHPQVHRSLKDSQNSEELSYSGSRLTTEKGYRFKSAETRHKLAAILSQWSYMDSTWSWSSKTLSSWCEELTHCKRPRCCERLGARGEGDDRGWDDWITSMDKFEQTLGR